MIIEYNKFQSEAKKAHLNDTTKHSHPKKKIKKIKKGIQMGNNLFFIKDISLIDVIELAN